MGFKLPGKSVHSGTSSHRSALAMKSEYDAAAKYKAEQAAAKMYDSPADMALKGDQHKLPQHLQDGIEAAPETGSSANKSLPGDAATAGGRKVTLSSEDPSAEQTLPPKQTSEPKKPSPNKLAPLLPLALGGLRVAGGQLVKRGIPQALKRITPSILPNSTKFVPNALGRTLNTAKGLYNKIPSFGKTVIKQGLIYAGIDAGMGMFGGDDDKKQKKTNTTVTPPKTTKKKKSNGSYSRAKKNDPNLESYIAGRKKHAKGSNEYNAFQNKINKAYGSKTRHGVESSITTKGRKTTSKLSTPGIGTTTRMTKTQRDGDVKLKKSTFSDDKGVTTKKTRTKRGVFSDKVRSKKSKFVTTAAPGSNLSDKKTRLKTRYTKSGDVKSQKRVTKQDGMRTVTKTNRKGKTTTKTRKTLNPFD